MEAMDGSVAVRDGSDRGADETRHGGVDHDAIIEDDSHSRGSLSSAHSTVAAVPGECVHDGRNAAGDADRASPEDSAASAGNRCSGPDVQDIKDARLDSESDDNGGSETTSLEACMTPSGRDYYLRRGGGPRQRSALRLSRILARQQLLHRLSRGRDRFLPHLCSFFFRQKSWI